MTTFGVVSQYVGDAPESRRRHRRPMDGRRLPSSSTGFGAPYLSWTIAFMVVPDLHCC
jgi:hypothetical protein